MSTLDRLPPRSWQDPPDRRVVGPLRTELDRDVELSLQRSFPVPDLSGLLGRVEAAAARLREHGRESITGTVQWLAAAGACLFMVVTMSLLSLLSPASEPSPSRLELRPATARQPHGLLPLQRRRHRCRLALP